MIWIALIKRCQLNKTVWWGNMNSLLLLNKYWCLFLDQKTSILWQCPVTVTLLYHRVDVFNPRAQGCGGRTGAGFLSCPPHPEPRELALATGALLQRVCFWGPTSLAKNRKGYIICSLPFSNCRLGRQIRYLNTISLRLSANRGCIVLWFQIINWRACFPHWLDIFPVIQKGLVLSMKLGACIAIFPLYFK